MSTKVEIVKKGTRNKKKELVRSFYLQRSRGFIMFI